MIDWTKYFLVAITLIEICAIVFCMVSCLVYRGWRRSVEMQRQFKTIEVTARITNGYAVDSDYVYPGGGQIVRK